MKKIIKFDKQIEFPSMIGEITSISLDQNLSFKDESNIVGSLVVSGTYKRTEATRLEEDFSFDLPTEIILTEKLDLNTVKIEIDDFYYEIEKDDTINCHILIMVEGMEVIEVEEDDPVLENHESVISTIEQVEDTRECDGDNTYEEEYNEVESQEEVVVQKEEVKKEEIKEEITKEVKKEITKESEIEKKMTIDEENEDVGSLFTALKDSEETFSTYSVYIVRSEETVESIMSKFKITKEELESYNDISSIGVGSKVIIPLNEKD